MATKKKTGKNKPLVDFVQHLADEPAFQKKFKKDPAAAMDEHKLTAAHREAVMSGQQAVAKLIAPVTAKAMMLINEGDEENDDKARLKTTRKATKPKKKS